jgi:hypothetical protein
MGVFIHTQSSNIAGITTDFFGHNSIIRRIFVSFFSIAFTIAPFRLKSCSNNGNPMQKVEPSN